MQALADPKGLPCILGNTTMMSTGKSRVSSPEGLSLAESKMCQRQRNPGVWWPAFMGRAPLHRENVGASYTESPNCNDLWADEKLQSLFWK